MNFNYFISKLCIKASFSSRIIFVAEVSDFDSMEIIDSIEIYDDISKTIFDGFTVHEGINKIKYYDGRNFAIYVG